MADNVKEAAQRKLNGPKGDQALDKVNCIADQAFQQMSLDAIFDEIESLLAERRVRLEGALAMIGAAP